MRPRIHVITPAVGDLPRVLAFDRDGLGLPSPAAIGAEFASAENHPSGGVVAWKPGSAEVQP